MSESSPESMGCLERNLTTSSARDRVQVATRAPTPDVTVVVNCCNDLEFLEHALGSVLSQTRQAKEIIVVDDGSVEDPARITGRYTRVRLIRQSNQGLAAARNTGLSAASAEMIVFLDADDLLLPHALDAGLACHLRAPGSAFVYGGHRRVDQHGRPIGPDRYDAVGNEPYRNFLCGNIIGMHATVMYRRDKLLEAGGFSPALRRCEDYDLYLRLSRTLPVASHPAIVAEYRWHGGNMSGNRRTMLRSVLSVHGCQAIFADRSPDTAADWRRGRRIWRDYYASEVMEDAKAAWRSRDIYGTVKGVAMAATMSPQLAVRDVLQMAWHQAKRVLLPGLVDRLKRSYGYHVPPALGQVCFGDLDTPSPVSRDFGFDRGTPVDRYYIESFLWTHRSDIAGRVLEVGDDSYTRRFGGSAVTRRDVLHIHAEHPAATIVGDLSVPGTLPTDAFDCLLLTQTLHLVYDMRAAVAEIFRALKPNGVVLLTVPGISQLDRGEWSRSWFWSLTPASARRLFADVFGEDTVIVEAHGNVFAAIAFLQGVALEELDRTKLDVVDEAYPMVVTIRARKPQHA